jgi:hypothetical protein
MMNFVGSITLGWIAMELVELAVSYEVVDIMKERPGSEGRSVDVAPASLRCAGLLSAVAALLTVFLIN